MSGIDARWKEATMALEIAHRAYANLPFGPRRTKLHDEYQRLLRKRNELEEEYIFRRRRR